MFTKATIDKALLRTALLAAMLCLAACSGSSSTIEQIDNQGQQLSDLKEAYDKGVITAKQYDQTKARILEQN